MGARLIPDPRLLSLVVNLNEYPSVVCGSFSSDFLRLPREVLVTAMREHQKYFSLVDADGQVGSTFSWRSWILMERMLNRFVLVTNECLRRVWRMPRSFGMLILK